LKEQKSGTTEYAIDATISSTIGKRGQQATVKRESFKLSF